MKCAAFAILSALVASSALADEPQAVRKGLPVGGRKIDKILYQRFGGKVVKPGTGTGVTGFVNVKGCVDTNEIRTVMGTIATQLRHPQKLLTSDRLEGLPTRALVKELGLDVGVFIVMDDKLPPLLVAPEDRWALVNVAQLRKGISEDAAGKRLFAARCRGELQRAFCYACGCGSSQYKGNIMDVTEVGELDALNPDLTVADAMVRCRTYLESINVTQPIVRFYSAAVQEGWAPAPTDTVQKAIWDKVHALPSKPIKIEFDPKTDTK